MRPDWDSYFLKIAYAVSERSTCDRAFVGCVLVLDKRILTSGFNGSPAGQDHIQIPAVCPAGEEFFDGLEIIGDNFHPSNSPPLIHNPLLQSWSRRVFALTPR